MLPCSVVVYEVQDALKTVSPTPYLLDHYNCFYVVGTIADQKSSQFNETVANCLT
jgi:hypothetical protein